MRRTIRFRKTGAKKVDQPESKSAEIEKRLKSLQQRPNFGYESTFGVFQPLLPPFHPKYKPAFQYVRPAPVESKLSKDEIQRIHDSVHQMAQVSNHDDYNYSQQQYQYQQQQHQQHQQQYHHDEIPPHMFSPPALNPYESYSQPPVFCPAPITEENISPSFMFPNTPQETNGNFGANAFAPYPIEPVQFNSVSDFPGGGVNASQQQGLSPELVAFLRSNGKPTTFDDIFLDCGIKDLRNEDIAILENYQKDILTNRVPVSDDDDCIRILLLGLCISVDTSSKAPQVFYIGHSREKLEQLSLLVGFYQSRTSIIPSLASDESTNLAESSIIFAHWNDIDKYCLNYLDDIKLVILDDGDSFVRQCPRGSDDYDAFVVLRTEVLRHALFVVLSSHNPSEAVAHFMTELNA